MYLKPVSGRQVPDPDKGGMLPPAGRHVVPHQYWLRRIADGDVVKAEPPPAAPAAKPATPAKVKTKE